ncbi:nitroreductase family protein [Pseudohongiella spirulinae]|uniref:Putative NAD(P)H nitroreductase n=1 Tax=Pseudohongiella spirulinae TaxID=1249552 RepID=A0A0S2KF76_9GAMM|nr:nitroreductase [Pseudohongiella spirulinae]ALO46692.1 Nitroreductase [Pseudohongiella spirulinae]
MNDLLEKLHNRVSAPRLTGPEPDASQLDAIYRAALRAADHALLRPWRFLVIKGDARYRLGDLWAKACHLDNCEISPEELQAQRNKLLRAPIIIVGIVSPKEHPKVPVTEQHLSAGAALQNMLNAAHALDLGAIWRTGPMAEHPLVLEGLGLQPHEAIIGFLYLGQVDGPRRPLRPEPTTPYFQEW